MYESVVYVGLGVAVHRPDPGVDLSQAFHPGGRRGRFHRGLDPGRQLPGVLDSSLQPLQPVLRNNFWLVTHVMTITLSYAAFALAMGIGNITLGYYLFARAKTAAIEALEPIHLPRVAGGRGLAGRRGRSWAASGPPTSWGRFWGWDPKEVWALIALLGYLAVLHARFAGWVKHFGLAVLSVACFALVIVAWYGVNFVLGAGLHSYGFSARPARPTWPARSSCRRFSSWPPPCGPMASGQWLALLRRVGRGCRAKPGREPHQSSIATPTIGRQPRENFQNLFAGLQNACNIGGGK